MWVIAIEGIDGTGKTTLWNNLKELMPSYVTFTTSPDPYGPLRDEIRKRIHSDKRKAIEEGYLFAADRIIQYNRLKEADVEWVITDRSTLSSMAYQGASCTPPELHFIETLFSKVPMLPNFVIYLDAEADDPRILERLKSRGSIDGMESTEYQKAVSHEYRSLLENWSHKKLSPFEESPKTTALIAERAIRSFIARQLKTDIAVDEITDDLITHDLLAWGPCLETGTVGKANFEAMIDICVDMCAPYVVASDHLENKSILFDSNELTEAQLKGITAILKRLDDYILINEDFLTRVEDEILDEYMPGFISKFYEELAERFDNHNDLSYENYPWLWYTATDWCFNMGYEWHHLHPTIPASSWEDAVNMAAMMLHMFDTHEKIKSGEYTYVEDDHGWWKIDQFEIRPTYIWKGIKPGYRFNNKDQCLVSDPEDSWFLKMKAISENVFEFEEQYCYDTIHFFFKNCTEEEAGFIREGVKAFT